MMRLQDNCGAMAEFLQLDSDVPSDNTISSNSSHFSLFRNLSFPDASFS